MKILQVAYKSTISGGEKVLYDLAVSLKERGHQVLAVCPAPGQLPERMAAKGIQAKIIPFHKTYDLPAALRLSRFIRKERIEVLHSHSTLTNIISRIAGRLSRVPVSVSTVHLTLELSRGGRGGGRGERLKAVYYRLLDNFTARFNDRVIAVSGAVRDDLIEQGIPGRKITVIQNGIAIPEVATASRARIRKELGIRPEETVIGAVGRLSPQKDYPTLFRAFREALRQCPRSTLVIAGNGPLREALERLADELGIGARVIFLGYREDVMEVVSGFDIYALSSLWEGLPLAVLEAMMLSRPVVATAVPGTAEAVVEGETGFLVPLEDPEALGRRLTELAADPDRARRMGEAGARRARERFGLERVVSEHETLYRELLAARRGGEKS